MPLYNPDKNILKKVLQSLKKQKFSGNFEIIQVNEKKGFAEQMNLGIRKARYPLVVMLPQDCVPETSNWLEKLISPFRNDDVVASVSRVTLPNYLWQSFGILTKAILIKEQGTIDSLLDGKGSAYKKKAIVEIGLFDNKTFLSAGEDFDTYIKLKEKGSIILTDASVLHIHPTTFIKRLRKNYQYANAYGTLVRIYREKMPGWYIGLAHATPIVGVFTMLAGYPLRKNFWLFPPFILVALANHLFYIRGFWMGFFNKRQTVR